MTEYIDKTEAMRRFMDFGREIPKEQVMAVLASIKEGVVRCGECKHLYNDADTGKACEFTNMGMKPDDFCSFGERKDDE